MKHHAEKLSMNVSVAFSRRGRHIASWNLTRPAIMKIDRCIQEDNVPIALREDKLEFGHGGSDPYMQIARCYDLLVEVLTTRSAKGQQLSRTWSSMSLDLSYRYMVLFTHPCICWLDFAQGRCWSYVVGSMMVTNQLLNHLASLFSCSPIIPGLVKPK